MIKTKPGVKLVGHIYKRCRQAEETCKAGRETSSQAEESEASIDLVGLQEPQSYREKQAGMIKAKPEVKLVGHIYKRCRQAEETCKAGRETSRQAEESEASIDLVGLQEIW